MPPRMIRILLVEDSPVASAILQRLLRGQPDLQVVGVARHGLEALALIPQVNPQIICTDLHMPRMDGLELTREVMARCPRPILVISASVQEEDTHNVFRILEAGALDIFPKPITGLTAEYEKAQQELLTKIRVLSGVSVFTQHRRDRPAPVPRPTPLPAAPRHPALDIRAPRVLAIGASTGGPQALQTIFEALPAKFPVPILCVQHISAGFLGGLIDWLNVKSRLRIRIAEAGELPQTNTVYFAPERHHLQLDSQGRLRPVQSAPVCGHCPSVTVLFESVANHYRRSAAGILLTGMGRDGADGLQAIAQVGGTTIAQDEATSVVFGMPKEAIALGAAQHVLPIQKIPPFLLEQVFSLSVK